jgi:putative salt-induced outer membrane protein YdiY
MRHLLGFALLLVSAPAAAQTFTYGNPDDVKEVKEVDWTATAEGGLLFTTGNARTTTVTAAAKSTRLSGKDKLAAELGLAYARSTVLVPEDDGDGVIENQGEIGDKTSTTANTWKGIVRYDRFLTAMDSLYIAALASADRPAGKSLVAGGQVGYSRTLVKKDVATVVTEVGYDFSYEDPVTGDGVAIHSARAFAGYKGTINERSAVEASLEVLSNLNTLDTVPEEAGFAEDTRVSSMASINSKITEDISLSVSIGAKYDNHPSPLPPFAGFTFAPGFVPVAEKLDTITKATLIISLF